MTEKLDAFDIGILSRLQENSAISLDVLAEELNLSRNACWRRVKHLEAEKVIKRRVALIDPEQVGLGLSAIVLIRTSNHNADWLRAFRRAVLTMPQIQGAYRMTGDLDYVLRVRVADVKAYDAFYQDLISQVEISDVSASFVMEEIKDTTSLALQKTSLPTKR